MHALLQSSELSVKRDLIFYRGETFELDVNLESCKIVYVPITGITKDGSPKLTVTSHGMPDGWRCLVSGVVGMSDINAPARTTAKDYHIATFVDTNTIELNGVNATTFTDYESGGVLQYFQPVSLVDHTADMSVTDEPGGTQLMEISTSSSGIVIIGPGQLRVTVPAQDTLDAAWSAGHYNFKVVSPDGVPVSTGFFSGAVTVEWR